MDINSVRLRYSMLLNLHMQMKNYVNCMNRGYLGELEDFEKKLIDEIDATTLKMKEAFWQYTYKQEKESCI